MRELILELPAPDALPARSRAAGIAALNHEVFYASVEGDAVVVPGLAQHDEILTRAGRDVAVQLDVEVPVRRSQTNVPLLLRVPVHHFLHPRVRRRVAHDGRRERRRSRAGGAHIVHSRLHRDVMPRNLEPLHRLRVPPTRLGVARRVVRRLPVRIPRVRTGAEPNVIQRVARGARSAKETRRVRVGSRLGGWGIRRGAALRRRELALRLRLPPTPANLQRRRRVLRAEFGEDALDVGGDARRVDVADASVVVAAGVHLVASANVLEGVHRPRREVHGVLDRHEVLARELLVRQEVLPVLGLDAEFVDGLVAVDVSRGLHRDDVRRVGEHLVQDGALVLAVGVLVEVELEEVLQGQGLARDGVLAVLLDVRHGVHDVHHGAVVGAHRIVEGEERDGAAVEGEAAEGDTHGLVPVPAAVHLPLRRRHVSAILRGGFLTHGVDPSRVRPSRWRPKAVASWKTGTADSRARANSLALKIAAAPAKSVLPTSPVCA